MKKILSLILTFLIIFTLAGCGSEKNEPDDNKASQKDVLKDFVYTTVKGEYILLTLYNGNDKDIVIPEKANGLPVKTIGSGCFATTDIESVIVPDSVTEIWDSAFFHCKNLSKITLSKNITAIAPKTFEGCTALTDIEIPEKVTVIDAYAFFECASLTKLTVPQGVTTVATYAFLNSGITELKFLGNAPSSIGNDIIGKKEGITIYRPTNAVGWDHKKLEGYNLSTY